MRTNSSRKTLKWAFVAVVLLPLCGAPAFALPQDSSQKPTGDAVADAARKAREQRKEAAKTKKVYTNEDLGGLPANAVSTLGAAPDAKAAEGDQGQGDKVKADGTAETDKDKDKDQEKAWRKRFKEAYAKLAQLEKELDILQREGNKAELQYYPDPQKAMSEGYSRKEINDTQAKITQKKQEIDQQKQHISDMEDNLRKAGGDPGWASPQ